MDLAARTVKQQVIEAPVVTETGADNPTQIRYGWCPFKEINLVGPMGNINLYVQPHEIAGPDGRAVPNPYHRVIPKGQLIPFPTFTIIEQSPSPDRRDGMGRPLLDTIASTRTAFDAAKLVLMFYSRWGFTVFRCMQGIEDQATAFRIFTVVQPLDYPLSQLQSELEVGAIERIAATSNLVYDLGNGEPYIVECLKSDEERRIATLLAEEMSAGADVAVTLANETLDGTETSMVGRFSGGNGKTGPDPLDRYLSEEMERELPKLIGKEKSANLENKIDYLVSKEQSREAQEEIARLKQELADLKAAQAETTVSTSSAICGGTKGDGTICQTNVKPGTRCRWHEDQPFESDDAPEVEPQTE
jgi:hypothetical protein